MSSFFSIDCLSNFIYEILGKRYFQYSSAIQANYHLKKAEQLFKPLDVVIDDIILQAFSVHKSNRK